MEWVVPALGLSNTSISVVRSDSLFSELNEGRRKENMLIRLLDILGRMLY